MVPLWTARIRRLESKFALIAFSCYPIYESMYRRWTVASDIDNTLTGNREALNRLRRKLQGLRERGELYLILSTGRHMGQILYGFEHEGIPMADALVTQVGTEIFLPPFSEESRPVSVWNDLLHQDFDRKKVLRLCEGFKGLKLQNEEFNTELKVSFTLQEEDSEKSVDALRKRIKEDGDGLSQVIWSSGKDLDIIPTAAGKGKAIKFLLDWLQLSSEEIVVAGDSGNDQSMFEEIGKGIIVANAQEELKGYQRKGSANTIYCSKKEFAAGVEEGLIHFGLPL